MKKKNITYIIKLCLLCVCIACTAVTNAQIDIKVTVLPPYSSHITDFASHPQQIMIMVHNSGNVAANIQLRGSITGDNGISIGVNNQYRSGSPLHLSAGEIRNLTGSDINALFDYNQLVFHGISRDQLITQGNLPEGNYQICVKAFDYNNNNPLSEDQCSNIFPISSVEPPTIIKPMDEENISSLAGQNFVITWTMPAGSPPSTQYTVKIVEILDNRSPENAIMSATQPAFFQTTVTGTSVLLYNQAMPALTVGRHYAMVVVAKDPTNTITFRNNGQSEVVGFVYGEAIAPLAAVDNNDNVVCSCKTPAPVNTQPSTKSIAVGGTIKAGSFNVTVLSLIKNNDNTITGKGKVNLPVVNSSFIPIGVDFTNIQVNSSNELIGGSINARVKATVNFLPNVPSPNPSLIPFTQDDVNNLSNYIDNNTSSVVSQIKNAGANTVFELPVGIDKQVSGSPITIEITALKISATQATMDAATIIHTPDGGAVSRIALGAKNVCVNPTDLCGDAKLFLAEDITLPALNLTLRGAGSPRGGTYIVFDKDGFKTLQIAADMALPQSLVVKKADNASPVTAQITATTDKGWTDWMAQVSIDPFVIAGNKDFGFTLMGAATYDHSDVQNPANMPNIAEKPEIKATQWHGFYMPQLTMDLPAILKTAAGTGLQASIQNLILDNSGVTANVGATNILQLGNGSLDGWYYSIDNIGISIVNNSFKNGGMDGKLVLPVSDMSHQNAQLNYHSTLSNGNNGGGIQFQFVIAPRNDLDFALWLATAQIDQSSNITISTGGGKDFSAAATLNGHVSIDANLPVVGKVNFAQMKFENLNVNTTGPNYLDLGNSVFSLASPQHSIGGSETGEFGEGGITGSMGDFPVTLTDIKPYTNDGKFGVKFTLNVKLSDIDALPNASTTLSVYGKFKFDNGRPKFYFDPGNAVQLDQISVKGDLGALKIDGTVDFYHNDPTFGNGFKGNVQATFPAIGIGIASNIQFGGVNGFKYWYVDAMVDLGQAGIILGNSGLSIFGFGGGAYYHMKKPGIVPPPSSIVTKDPGANPAVGASQTGNVYTPDVNTALGIKGTLLFGLNARPTFNADVTLEVAFNGNGGINLFAFEGNARILEITGGNACIKGNIQAQFDFQNSIFACHVGAELQYPPVVPIMTGSFNADFYFAPSKWYIKFGTPAAKNNITYLGVLKYIESYMEVGNYEIDPMPPIPQQVRDVLVRSGVNPAVFQRPIDPQLDRGEGFIFGADAGFDYQGQFAIFKARFGATVGFDVSLKKYGSDDDITCDNGQKTIGADGWYAMGQVYAGIWGSIDISTDFFGDINILDVGAGAALMAGLPNPTYVSGAIGGYYSVLDGAISGSLHFEFTAGSKCTVSQDALSGLKLIGGVTPVDASKNMEIDTYPAIAFNYNLASNPYSTFSISTATGRRTFRFNENCINVNIHDNTHGGDLAVTKVVSSDRTGMTVGPVNGLQRITEYTFTVSAHLEEKIGAVWATAKYASGKNAGLDYVDTKSVTYTTNKGFKTLEGRVEYSYPLKWQRYFMPEEASTTAYGTGNAVLKATSALNENSFDMSGPDEGYTRSFYARLTPVSPPGAAIVLPFSFQSDESGKISFELPASDLTANTIYALQFIGKSVPKGTIASNFLMNSLVNTAVLGNVTQLAGKVKANAFTVENKIAVYQGMQQGSHSNDTIRSRSVNDMTALKSYEMELYMIYFKTSNYNHFGEKGTNMPITNIQYAVTGAPNTDSYTMSITELNNFQASGKSIKAYLANKLLGITDTSATNPIYKAFSVDYLKGVYFDGKEYFDDYDVNGHDTSGVDKFNANFAYHIKPLVSIENTSTTGWLNYFSNNLLSQYNLKIGYGDINLAYDRLTGGIETSHPIEKIDAKNVGNIDMNVVKGMETTAYYLGQMHYFGWGSIRGGSFYAALPIDYTLKATYTKTVKYEPGRGGTVPWANMLEDFLNVHGGDPQPDQLIDMGRIYDVSVNASVLNNSVQGNVLNVGYQLPGLNTVNLAPAASLQVGNISKLNLGVIQNAVKFRF